MTLIGSHLPVWLASCLGWCEDVVCFGWDILFMLDRVGDRSAGERGDTDASLLGGAA